MTLLPLLALVLVLIGLVSIVVGVVRRPAESALQHLSPFLYIGGTLLLAGIVVFALTFRSTLTQYFTPQEPVTSERPFSVMMMVPDPAQSVARNSSVRVIFSQPLANGSATRMRVVRVEDSGALQPVPGSLNLENNANGKTGSIVYQPFGACGGSPDAGACFAVGTYRVELDSASIKNEKGDERIACGGEYVCSFEFTVGETLDTTSPSLVMESSVTTGVDAAALVPLEISNDDVVMANVTLNAGQVEARSLGWQVLSSGETNLLLDTSTLLPNSNHVLTVTIADAAGNQSTATSTLHIRTP